MICMNSQGILETWGDHKSVEVLKTPRQTSGPKRCKIQLGTGSPPWPRTFDRMTIFRVQRPNETVKDPMWQRAMLHFQQINVTKDILAPIVAPIC